MKKIIATLLFHLNLIIFTLGQNIKQYPTFGQYVEMFNKTYVNLDEYTIRQDIYNQNVARFSIIQAQLGIEAGVNQFTDRTDQQLQQMRNKKLTPLYRSQTPHFSISRKLGGLSSLDWRTRGGVSPVKDQGPCGSCWAFATAAYCQSSLIINNGAKNNIDLSEQYLLQCTQQSDCQGGYPAYALLQVVSHGIPKQQTYEYTPLQQHEGICDTRKVVKIKGKQVYVYFQLSDLQMIYLLHSSPIIVGVGSQDWQYYKGGVMKCKPNVTEDHAVLLVGYTPQYWIIKNHWGPTWGEKGFIRISRNKQSNCLMGIEVDVLHSWIIQNTFIILLVIILLIFI